MQQAFTKRIKGLHNMTYWQRLKHLKIRLLERRMERYQCINMFKIISSLVPNFGVIVDNRIDTRTGQFLCVPTCTGVLSSTKTLKEGALGLEGLRLYNSSPKAVRNFDV